MAVNRIVVRKRWVRIQWNRYRREEDRGGMYRTSLRTEYIESPQTNSYPNLNFFKFFLLQLFPNFFQSHELFSPQQKFWEFFFHKISQTKPCNSMIGRDTGRHKKHHFNMEELRNRQFYVVQTLPILCPIAQSPSDEWVKIQGSPSPEWNLADNDQRCSEFKVYCTEETTPL